MPEGPPSWSWSLGRPLSSWSWGPPWSWSFRPEPVPPPKSALKAARALGKLPSVMSLSWPPAVSLNEKMLVKATLLDAIQLANWLMK